MQTIRLDIEDNLYKEFTKRQIDIQKLFKSFLSRLLSNDYPSINTDEAKKRVQEIVQSYKKGKDNDFTQLHDDFWEKLDSKIEKV